MSTSTPKRVMLLGILPSEVDFSKMPPNMPVMNEEILAKNLQKSEDELIAAGYDAKWLLVDLGKTAKTVLREKLATNTYDCVLIGAGIRVMPENFDLFEQCLNIIHELAPTAKICFNQNPLDSLQAVKRWV
jgi:hypothetical protein